MTAFLVFGAGIALAFVLVAVRENVHAETDVAIRAWAAARAARAQPSGALLVRVDDVPVEIRRGSPITAVARRPFVCGPRFQLVPSPSRLDRRYPAEVIGQAIGEDYRCFGDGDRVLEQVASAVLVELSEPMHMPVFSSDGYELHVALHRADRDIADIDAAVAIAASLVADDLELVQPIATALNAEIELDDEGLAFASVPRRAPIRITFEPGDGVTRMRIVGTTEETLYEVARESQHVTPENVASVLGRGSPRTSSLRALLELGDGWVAVRPRGVEVQFFRLPEVERVVLVVDRMEAMLVPERHGPFR